MLGVAYKADISDMRESPAVKLIELLQNAGADVSYHDPHVPSFTEHGTELVSQPLEPGAYDAVVIATAHSEHRLRPARRRRAPRRRPPQRARPARDRRREGLEAVTRVAHAGVGGWGKNVVRVVGELAELAWVVDTDEARQAEYAARYPQARVTGSFAEALADDTVDAVAIATPVPTHYALAKQALEAGKHVFVEKPPAMRGEEMEELVALARASDLVLMPGHLLLYHPGLRKVKELVDAGELGDVACVYGNRQNLGVIRSNENALWSLGVHDLSVILWLLGEEPSEAVAHGVDYLQQGIEDVVFCFLRFPSGKVAHMHLSWLDPHKMRKMTVVGREKMVVFDDMELERKVTVYEKGPWEPAADLRRVAHAHRRHLQPQDRERRAAAARAAALPAARRGGARRPPRGDRRARRRAHARPADDVAAHRRARRERAEIHPSAIVYPGTVLGEGVKVLENAVVGKQPTLSPRSTAKREPLPPTVIGDGTIVSTGAIVFAGTTIGDARDPRRPVVRPRARHDRRRRRRRPRLAGRERHHDRRDDEDPGRRLHHRLLDARGARLHRAVRRDDERQLDGPHREAVRQHQGPDDPPRRPDRRRRHPLPGDRDRRGGVRRRRRGRDEGRAAAASSSSGAPRASCATSRRTSCSTG